MKTSANKFLVFINIIASLSCIALAVKYIAMPIYAKKVYGNEYKKLVFQCDNVMRDHLISKHRVINEKSETSVKQLRAAEVGLLTCHDYDKLRKKLQMWGVTESELSMIGLESIEEKAEDVRKFVDSHEIRY